VSPVISSDSTGIAHGPATVAGRKRRSLCYRAVKGKSMNDAMAAARLQTLRIEHRDLDAAIASLVAQGGDQLQLARLKKRKLRLRDEIAALEDSLIPDIIA
jgi:hypothetical protein